MSAARVVGRHGRRLGRSGLPWLLPAVLLLGWQLAVSLQWLSTSILPSPLEVGQAAWELTRSGELWQHILISSQRAALGFVIGAGIGFTLGLLNGLSHRAETLLDTSVQMIRNVPHLALIPLVIIWFGIGDAGKVFLVVLGVFFPVYVNTLHGIKSVDPGLIEMGRSYGLGQIRLFLDVIFPGALPSIFVGVRYALGFMWLTLIVSETIATTTGIGYMAMNAREFMRLDVVVLGILIYAVLGKLADTVARLLERQALAWHPGYHPR